MTPDETDTWTGDENCLAGNHHEPGTASKGCLMVRECESPESHLGPFQAAFETWVSEKVNANQAGNTAFSMDEMEVRQLKKNQFVFAGNKREGPQLNAGNRWSCRILF